MSISPQQAEEVVAKIAATWPELLESRRREQWPFAEARVFIDDGTARSEFFGVAMTPAELRRLVAGVGEVYFQIHLWFGETIVGNGTYFNVGDGSLLYQEHGACRGIFKIFRDLFTEFVDELAAESWRPLSDQEHAK